MADKDDFCKEYFSSYLKNFCCCRDRPWEFCPVTSHCTCQRLERRRNSRTSSRNMKLVCIFTAYIIISCLVWRTDALTRTETERYELCIKGNRFEGFAPKGGTKAGKYHRLGKVESFEECINLCCWKRNCKMALMLRTSCFQVDCKPNDGERTQLCKPVAARHSKYNPKLFIRGEIGRPSKVAVAHSGIESFIANRGKSSCQHYHGSVCSSNLDSSGLYYFSTNPSDLEKKYQRQYTLVSQRLDEKCKKYALRAICHTWFPKCTDPKRPMPLPICKSECEKIQDGVCTKAYDLAAKVKYLQKILPDCDQLPDEEEEPKCLKLDDIVTSSKSPTLTSSAPALNSEPTDDKVGSGVSENAVELGKKEDKINEEAPREKDDKDKESKSVMMTTLPLSRKLFTRKTVTTLSPSVSTPTSAPVTTTLSVSRHSNPTTTVPSKSEKLQKSLEALGGVNPTTSFGSTVKPSSPTIVNSSSTEEGTKLSEKSTGTKHKNNLATPRPAVHVTAPAEPSIQVSAGDNKVISLPQDSVSLYASTWPKARGGKRYRYKWYQLQSPAGNRGYMEGRDASRLRLSQLSVPGVYQFKVIVTSDHAKGEGFVNVTVKPAPRVNHAPRAEIHPKETTITLPTHAVVLDGSKSSDDDKIVQYKWEELKGPIVKHRKVIAKGTDTPILQLKNLEAGVYTFRLTVTDSDGEEDHTDAKVTVKAEKDYPPTARAGNDVILNLPHNYVTLYGNASTDDKGIKSYEWSKSSESPKVGDMQGTNKPILKVSNLVKGTYTFVLKVTDTSDQSTESEVHVVVRPEKNSPPKAVAGSDKDLVYPDDSTTLDARKSHDDGHIVKFLWEKISGPDSVEMKGADKAVLRLTKLTEGRYVFKLTVTDDKGLKGSDTVSINVKKTINQPPIANAGPDIIVVLPNRAAQIDGSKSKDDQWITSYQWERDAKSPAAGDILNGSDHQPILRLANLIEGIYTFTLTVVDNKGLKDTDTTVLTVKEDTNSLHLVELYLDVDIFSFTEASKHQLLRKLSVVLNVDDGNVVLEQIRPAGFGRGVILLFYVTDSSLHRKLDGQMVAELLKQKIGYHGTLFEYKMLQVEPYVCRNNCSGHGYCDRNTKLCVCDNFWMQNLFKANFAIRESNCDWSILYVTVTIFGIVMAFVGVTWALCFCFARRNRRRRGGRYVPVKGDDDDDSKEHIMMVSKGSKYFAHSLTFTESDDDSDNESTVFDKKRLGNGSINGHNGSANGKVPRYKSSQM